MININGIKHSYGHTGIKIILESLKLIPVINQNINISWFNENCKNGPFYITIGDKKNILPPKVQHNSNLKILRISGDYFSSRISVNTLKQNNNVVELPVEGLTWIEKVPDNVEVILKDTENRVLAYKTQDLSIVSSICIGSIMVRLLYEEFMEVEQVKPDISNHPLFFLYYIIPNWIRNFFRKYYIAFLDLKVIKAQKKKNFRCHYPLEISGWALEMLLVLYIKKIVPELLSISMWPQPFKAAAILTHDIEPTEFAYTEGIYNLMTTIKSQKNNIQTICLVAKYSEKYLKNPEVIEWLKTQNILSHGYEHVNKAHLSFERVSEMVRMSKSILSKMFPNNISGFRGPRLQRGEKIMKALLEQKFKFSSSCIDSDRENTCSWGGGVGMIHPYFTPIKRGNELYQEELLEIPISAPDCIFPMFSGASEKKLHKIHQKKFKMVAALGGLYNSIIHAGVFDKKDSDIRMNLLKEIQKTVEDEDSVWTTSVDEVYAWWIERYNLKISLENEKIVIRTEKNSLPNKYQITRYEDHSIEIIPFDKYLNSKFFYSDNN